MRARLHQTTARWALASVMCTLAATPGCTFIGAGIGAGADPGHTTVRPGYDTARIPVGTTITVLEASGAKVRGTFRGVPNDAAGRPDHRFILVESDGRTEAIPVSQIYSVESKTGGNGWWIGGLAGLAGDVLVLAAISSSKQRNEPPPPSSNDQGGGGIGSCPFVYSFDGSGHRLDAELFSGALYPSAERSDWSVLDRIREDHGKLRLELRGNQGETQHVNQIALLVADHAPGVEVLPTSDGRLLGLANLAQPERASDYAGRDVRDRVATADGVEWVSDPKGRDAKRDAELRDHVDLTFARPAGVRHATLVLRVRNTIFGSLMQRKMLASLGPGLDGFYRQMEESALARTLVHDAMVREGMLLVQVRVGAEWRTVDHVWEVGPAVARDVAVPLDLGKSADRVLTVRLDSTVGLWNIDRAAVAFGKPSSIESVELAPSRAVDGSGADHRAELSSIDDRDYVMKPDSRAELEFRAPETRAGLVRSVFVKGTGWYHVEIRPEARGSADVAMRFVAEPGFFGRFALGELTRKSPRAASRPATRARVAPMRK